MDDAVPPVPTAAAPTPAAPAATAPPVDRMPLDRGDIAVVIPALNEALRIRGVVEGALAQCPRVVVIDDGSDDDTVAQLEGLPITLLRHAERWRPYRAYAVQYLWSTLDHAVNRGWQTAGGRA